jgi:hypothetical protein
MKGGLFEMRVDWIIRRNAESMYDVFKIEGDPSRASKEQLIQRDVPEARLKEAMDAHHVRGCDWEDVWGQLKREDEARVTINPWPPAWILM